MLYSLRYKYVDLGKDSHNDLEVHQLKKNNSEIELFKAKATDFNVSEIFFKLKILKEKEKEIDLLVLVLVLFVFVEI